MEVRHYLYAAITAHINQSPKQMGLFDRFKKQDCEICGKEVGMFGYKKLEDGEICKECVKLLSPWFEDRRHAMVLLSKTI